MNTIPPSPHLPHHKKVYVGITPRKEHSQRYSQKLQLLTAEMNREAKGTAIPSHGITKTANITEDHLSLFLCFISSASTDLTRTDKASLKYHVGRDIILRIMLTSNKQLGDSIALTLQGSGYFAR